MAKTRYMVHSYAGTISEWHHVDSYFVKKLGGGSLDLNY